MALSALTDTVTGSELRIATITKKKGVLYNKLR